MSKRNTRMRKIIHTGESGSAVKADGISSGRQKAIELIPVILLAGLGFIYSFFFFKHFVFPNSDFGAFLSIGQQWLHFQIPSDMKRAPVFSIITASAGILLPGPDRYLVGTELYNAILLPVVMILIYLLSREFLGRGTAIWAAFLCGISPWVVRLSSESLAELTLVTMFAATAICARRHIGWAYVFAMLGSITRWDLAALIPAVALVDIIRNRKWLRTVALTFLASIPFLICMVITAILLKKGQTSGAHYLEVLSTDMTFKLIEDIDYYWLNIASFFNAPMYKALPSGQIANMDGLNNAVFYLTWPLLLAGFIAGSIRGILNKRWDIIVLLISAMPYVLIHAMYPYRLSRFCIPVAWIGFIIAIYGGLWVLDWLRKKSWWKLASFGLQIVAVILIIFWIAGLGLTFKYAGLLCKQVTSLVIVACVVSIAGLLLLKILWMERFSLGWVSLGAFLVLAIVSNGAQTGFTMGNGQAEINFKYLSEWFLKNAGPDDKMITTMPSFMPIYTGLPIERFGHPARFNPKEVKDFNAFIAACRKEGYTLIAWDSRLQDPKETYYKLWGLDRIKVLSQFTNGNKQVGPCKLVYLLDKGDPQIAVWRIEESPSSQAGQ
jgi:hypothetical protein